MNEGLQRPRRHAGHADLRVRAAAQRAVEARPRGRQRRRAQPARIVPVVPAVDAAVGSRARSANWWRVRAFRARDRPVAGAIDSSIRTCCATRRHAEFGCHSLVPGTTVDELVAGFEEARRAGGDFCLATHYWEVDATLKDVLLRFLDHVARVPGRAVRAGRGAVRVTAWPTHAMGKQGRVALRRGVRRALSRARR